MTEPERRVTMDFKDGQFIFSDALSSLGEDSERHSGLSGHQEIIEIDLRNGGETLLSFIEGTQLVAFLAHPMTDLSRRELDEIAEGNRDIVQALDARYSPGFVWYDPADGYSDSPEAEPDTYINDFSALIGADVLVVNAFRGADGVGMLVQEAANLHMQIIVVVPEGRRLSPLFDGLPIKPHVVIAAPGRILADELAQAITASIRAIRFRNLALSDDRNSVHEQIPGVKLCEQRFRNGLTIEEIARNTGFTADFLHSVECDSRFLLMLNQTSLRVLSSAYGAESLTYSPNGMRMTFKVSEQTHDDVARQSLMNLASYYVQKGDRYSRRFDRRAHAAWCNYLDERAAGKTKDPGGRKFDTPVPVESVYSDVTDSGSRRVISNGWDRRVEQCLSKEGLV